MKRLYGLLVVALTLYGAAWAAPTITTVTGAPVEGDTLTITGTNFGTHDLDIEFLGGADGWIETEAVGTKMQDKTGWAGLSPGVAPTWLGSQKISNVDKKSGSQSILAHVDRTLTGAGSFESTAFFDHVTPEDKIYYSFWYKITNIDPVPGVPSPSTAILGNKMIRLTPDKIGSPGSFPSVASDQCGAVYYGSPYKYLAPHAPDPGAQWKMIDLQCMAGCPIGQNACCPGVYDVMRGEPLCNCPLGRYYAECAPPSFDVNKVVPNPDVWVRLESYADCNTMNTPDGEMWRRLLQNGGTSELAFWWQNITFQRSDCCRNVFNGSGWRYWVSQNLIQVASPNAEKVGADWFYDDIYIQFGTQARVVVGNQPTYAACTVLDTQMPTAWTGTSVNFKFSRAAFGASDKLYAFVVDSTGTPTNGASLDAYRVETVLPASAAIGAPFWADFWVKGGPWRAAAFKVYYDSTRVIPIRFDQNGVDAKGCISEFDDVVTRQPKCGTTLADADIWVQYDKDVVNADSVLVGRVQFYPFATGSAMIRTSCGKREGIEVLSQVNQACMAPFGALNPADANFANSEAIIFTDTAGSNYVTPASAAWTTVTDAITVTAGTGADWCTGNWDNHPAKEGGVGYQTPAALRCAPLAVVFTAKDSSVTTGDTLVVHMNVWADSVNAIEGFIEYSARCGGDGSVPGNVPFSSQWRASGFDQFEFTFDWDSSPGGMGAPWYRCWTGFHPSVPTVTAANKLIHFRASKTGGGKVSHAGPLLTLRFMPDVGCQETFSIGFPIMNDGIPAHEPCAPPRTYVGNGDQMSWCRFEYGNQPANYGTVYLYEKARHNWMWNHLFHYLGLSYSTGN